MTTHCKTPCPACPYSRTCEPGALGGSPVEKYIGQALGPFLLPCHQHCDFTDPDWKLKVESTPQCAGAAVFRANLGVNALMPKGLHELPANRGTVFSTAAEFVAHHRGVDLHTARMQLVLFPPEQMLRDELESKGRRIIPADKL